MTMMIACSLENGFFLGLNTYSTTSRICALWALLRINSCIHAEGSHRTYVTEYECLDSKASLQKSLHFSVRSLSSFRRINASFSANRFASI